MKKIAAIAVALVLAVLFASQARAQTWVGTYPKTGTVAGTILVKMTDTVPTGQTTNGIVSVMVWNSGGGPAKYFNFSITPGQTGAITIGEFTVNTLTTGQKYNVVMYYQTTDAGMGLYSNTADPGTATAK